MEAEYANGTTYKMNYTTEIEIQLGTYSSKISFIICPIGNQLILGTPWFEDKLVIIDVSSQTMTFQERAWPSSKILTLRNTN